MEMRSTNRTDMINEMRDIMIKRAGITKKMIIDVAMANWTRKNLDSEYNSKMKEKVFSFYVIQIPLC